MNRRKEIFHSHMTAMSHARFYMSAGHSVSFYRDMQDGHRVWVVEWKP